MEGAICRPTLSKTIWNCNSNPPLPSSCPTIKSAVSLSRTLSKFPSLYKPSAVKRPTASFTVRSSSPSVGNAQITEEPATKVKFQPSLTLPGCTSPLTLLGTGYREKVFAIIGVKVYAAGLYVNDPIFNTLSAWKGKSASEIEGNSALFGSMFQAPSEKALQIVLVRDVNGKTFWDALDDAISPRIKAPTQVDESALSTFRSIFKNRPLKKGNFIFLTWPDPSKLLVSVSSGGMPSGADATIESTNVASALFDVFFGESPVSPTLKTSVANSLVTILK